MNIGACGAETAGTTGIERFSDDWLSRRCRVNCALKWTDSITREQVKKMKQDEFIERIVAYMRRSSPMAICYFPFTRIDGHDQTHGCVITLEPADLADRNRSSVCYFDESLWTVSPKLTVAEVEGVTGIKVAYADRSFDDEYVALGFFLSHLMPAGAVRPMTERTELQRRLLMQARR